MPAPKFLHPLLCTLSLALGGPVLAHGDAEMAKMVTPHGGQMRDAGPWHVELVVARDSPEARDNPVSVYLTDGASQKVATTGASGTATLLAGREKVVIELRPDGENRLSGRGKYASDPAMKAIVSVTVAGRSEQARFTPLQ